jgi:hypothetical protein
MELSYSLDRRIEIIIIETLDHSSGGITEESRLSIVPISCQGIHTETLPEACEDLVLAGEELLEINEDSCRLARNIPAADADSKSLSGSLLLLLADTLSRSLGSGSALPVGAITSLLGAPFFIAIIFGRKENHR